MKKKLLFCFYLVFSFANIYSNNNLIMLPEISSAAATGIEGAYGAKSADLNTIPYNPAGIYGIKDFRIMFTYNDNELIKSNSTLTSVSIPFLDDSVFAIYYVYDRQYGVIDAPYGDSDLSRYNQIASLGYAFSMSENIKLGVAGKYISSSIISNSSSYLACDMGAVFGGDGGLTASITILNLGNRLSYKGDGSLLADEILPLKFEVGFNFDILKDDTNAISLSSDGAYYLNKVKYDIALGLEYVFQNMIIVRIGNKVDIKGSDFFSWGAGFNYDFNGIKTRLDYAYSGKLSGTGLNGAANLLSVSIFF